MAYVGPESSPISHTIITKLFVFIDIVCVICQSTGISLFSMDFSNRDRVSLGRTILLIGLIAQIISFIVFILIAAVFDVRSRRIKGHEIQRLRALFIVFYLSGVMIIVRSIFRAIGESNGPNVCAELIKLVDRVRYGQLHLRSPGIPL
jgi:O-antigen/teichoic acid export membrane protein